jgi:hypothetical protein
MPLCLPRQRHHRHCCRLCWSRSGSSRLTLCPTRLRHPPPANNEQNVSLPLGRWEMCTVSAALTPCLVDQSVRSCERVSRGKHVSNFPIGAMELFKVSVTRTLCIVDRSVRSCANVSRGKHVSNVPIGAMDLFKVSAARTYCSWPERSQLCKRESGQARQPFSHRPWELLNMSTHR